MKSPPQSGAKAETALSQVIEGLWIRFLPEINERVGILEEATSAAAANQLTEQRREMAEQAAHKLAGVLGTFGLSGGTDLARELETAFSSEASPDANSARHLAAIAAELRAIVESRPSNG
jgi:HPt (histidine-containing phosphotransfer) domain-containing protein